MSGSAQVSRVLRLPAAGRLFVCTDLHGNLHDFRRMRDLFEHARGSAGDCYLLFTGDLIHGPNIPSSVWPTFMGTFYEDESPAVIDEYIALAEAYPGRVFCLLGNHEHSHIGGPHTPKFWADETAHFEQVVGAERMRRYEALFRRLYLAAVTPCGVAVTHAAPNVVIAGPEELDALSLDGYEEMSLESVEAMPPLGRLLWSRRCAQSVARVFLDALCDGGVPLDVVVFGHDVVSEGFARFGDEQLLVSSSFGVRDERKYYLEIDLGAHYARSGELRQGVELRLLYEP